MADFIIAKHRHGSTGKCRIRFRKEFAKFEDYDGFPGDDADPMSVTFESKMNNDMTDIAPDDGDYEF